MSEVPDYKAMVAFAKGIVDESAAASGVILTSEGRFRAVLEFIGGWLSRLNSSNPTQMKIDWGSTKS